MATDQKQQAKKRKPNTYRPRSRAVNVSVWSANGAPVPDDVIAEIEQAIEAITLQAFNKGHRLLTQTVKA